jgi:hypothetical protein
VKFSTQAKKAIPSLLGAVLALAILAGAILLVLQ